MRPVAVITPADLAATEPVKVERCEYCDAGPACRGHWMVCSKGPWCAATVLYSQRQPHNLAYLT
jgi:hypothetical protein